MYCVVLETGFKPVLLILFCWKIKTFSYSLDASNQHLSTDPELKHQEVSNLQLQQSNPNPQLQQSDPNLQLQQSDPKLQLQLSNPNLQFQQSNPNLQLQQPDSEFREILLEKPVLEDTFEIKASIVIENDEEKRRIAEHQRFMAETLQRIELILNERDEILKEIHNIAQKRTDLFQGREKLQHDMTEFKIKSKLMCP